MTQCRQGCVWFHEYDPGGNLRLSIHVGFCCFKFDCSRNLQNAFIANVPVWHQFPDQCLPAHPSGHAAVLRGSGRVLDPRDEPRLLPDGGDARVDGVAQLAAYDPPQHVHRRPALHRPGARAARATHSLTQRNKAEAVCENFEDSLASMAEKCDEGEKRHGLRPRIKIMLVFHFQVPRAFGQLRAKAKGTGYAMLQVRARENICAITHMIHFVKLHRVTSFKERKFFACLRQMQQEQTVNSSATVNDGE